ncbi:MAG: hypothetical protein JNJ59_02565 [Deltaproteobacteria bacterium]|nr:hypothetical protein [Deltaproteobacteria bacterium]
MAQSKTCPSCHQQWAMSFKFCPDDGTALLTHEAPASRAPAQDTEPSLPPYFEPDPGPRSARPTVGAAPSPAKGGRAPAEQPRGRKHDGRLMNLEPVRPEPAAAPTRTEPAAPKRRASRTDQAAQPLPAQPTPVIDRARELRTAPTILESPAISEAMLAALSAERRDPTEPEMPAPSRPEPAAPKVQGRGIRKKTGTDMPAAPAPEAAKVGGKRKPGFSETAWFMRAVDNVDPETGRVSAAPDAYRPDTSIPSEKRKRYSLKRSDEE